MSTEKKLLKGVKNFGSEIKSKETQEKEDRELAETKLVV